MHTKIVEQIIEFSLKVIDVSLSEKNLSQINREKDQNIIQRKYYTKNILYKEQTLEYFHLCLHKISRKST